MKTPFRNSKRLFVLLSIASVSFGPSAALHAQTLTHRYSFQDPAGSQTFADSVGGTNWDGVLVNEFSDAYLTGSSLVLDGSGDYAELPAGLMTNYTQITVEFWADLSSGNPTWTRVFSFGDQNSSGGKNSGVDYCHYAGGNYQNLDVLSTNGADAYANNNSGLNGATGVHVTVVVDPVHSNMLYYNGISVVSTQHGNPAPLSQMNDTYNLIGKSLYNADPTLAATLYEFRVYSGALSESAVVLNDAAGPGVYLTSPGAIQSLIFSNNVNPLIVHQSSQETVIGNFPSVTNLNLALYGGVTYSSANTNIVTISTNGVVKGIGQGTTSIIATYGSLSVTNSITVVSVPTALVHRYSFASDASDSVGGANGTLMGDASVSGQLVLDGGGYVSLPGNIINIPTNAAVTFEAWVSIGQTAEWSHMFEFGATAANNVYCAPAADAGGFHEFGLSEGFSGGNTLSWAHGWANTTFHYTGIIDPTTSTLAVYSNGVIMQAIYNASAPLTDISTNNATIGMSSYGDPDATFTMKEFRIYNGALTPAQIAMSDVNGPAATNFNPGTLNSITVIPTNYPAFTPLVAPVVKANYSILGNFNLLPNTFAAEEGLVVTSSDPTIVSVNSQNMLTTLRPGTVTLTATYLGKSSSATVSVANQAVLAHRYSFTNDASDSVGGADGTLVGTASVSGGQVQLDGGSGDYVNLPGGLLSSYDSATMDIWATISSSQQHWSRLWEFADIGPATANELYFAPAWNGGANAAFFSYGVPFGGANLGPQSPALVNQTVHLTCVLGDGAIDLYTNGSLYMSTTNYIAPASQAGIVGSWIGFSPYGDPGITGSVDEYRIYQGRLSPEEIAASDVLGPNATLSTTPGALTVSAASGSITLSWPVASAGFAVQSTTDLSTHKWTTLTNAPTLSGSQWQVTLPKSGADQFFRLIR